MAFGKSLKETPTKQTAADSDQVTYEWQWMPIVGGNQRDKDVKGGTRKFKLLPEVDLNIGRLVLDDENNMQTASETRFLAVWMNVLVDGTPNQPRRIILDWRKRFKNPYWELVAAETEKGSPERKAMRDLFAINVLDKTPVLTDASGRYVYPDENGVYRLGANGKYVDVLKGTGTALNKVRILEASAGDAGGKHFLQQLMDAVTGLEDADGEVRQPYEAELVLKVSGIGVDTRRALRATANFSKPTDSVIYMPRYDLETWLKPWPDDAVKALINGADFNDVVEQFSLVLYPELVDLPTNEATTNDSALFDE